MEEIIDLIRKKENVVFFVGSGISFDYPSMLPGWEFVADGPIRSFYSKNFKEKQDNIVLYSKKLRPEMLMGIMYEIIGDKSIELLNVFKSNKCNLNHLFLASAMRDYNIPVITTNYDELIEQASMKMYGKVPNIYFNENGFRTWLKSEDEHACLIKLHGTISNKESIKAILQQVAAGPSDLLTDILKYFFENYTVIFWGYSLTDDFDIVPILRDLTPKNVIRLNYKKSNDEKTKSSFIENEQKLSNKLDTLMFEESLLQDKDRNIILSEIHKLRSEVNFGKLAFNSIQYSEYLHNPPIPIILWDKLKEKENEKKYNKFYSYWSKSIDNLDKLIIEAEILFYIQDKKETFQKVTDLSEKCISLLKKRQSPDIEQLSHVFFLKGWTHRMIGSDEDLCNAIECFKQSLSLTKDSLTPKIIKRKGYILHQMGLTYHRKGDFTSAIEKLKEALEIRKNLRDIPDIAYTSFQIFYIKNEIGKYKKGYHSGQIKNLKKLLSKAQSELTKIGDIKGVSIMVHNRAYIHQLIGKKKNKDNKIYNESIPSLKAAIKLYQYSIEKRKLIFDTGGITMANLRLTDCYLEIVKTLINNKDFDRARIERNKAEKYLKNVKEGYIRMKKEPYRQKNVMELEKEIEEINLFIF